MATIHKYYVLPKNEVQHIEVPFGSTLISAIEQRGCIVVYALIDYPDTVIQKVPIMCVGTGWELNVDDDLCIRRLIGTVESGDNVWHVLELEDVDRLPF